MGREETEIEKRAILSPIARFRILSRAICLSSFNALILSTFPTGFSSRGHFDAPDIARVLTQVPKKGTSTFFRDMIHPDDFSRATKIMIYRLPTRVERKGDAIEKLASR